MARNLEAIKRWVKTNRPDCVAHIDKLAEQEAFILIMAMAFNAGFQEGSKFQAESKPSNYYDPNGYFDWVAEESR